MKPVDQLKFLNTIIEFSHDGILLLDPGGAIISANPAASSIFGFIPESEILQSNRKFTDLFKFYDLDDTEKSLEQFPVSRALAGERVIDYKCTAINKENGKVWYGLLSAIPMLDESKRISGVVLSIKDITGSTVEIEKCQKDIGHCRSIISYMAEGVVVVDPDGTILELNPAAMRMYGFESLDKAVKNVCEYGETFNIYDLDDNLLPPEKWALSRALHGETFSNLEVKIHNKKTGASWIGNYSGTPVKDNEGKFILEVLTVQDITARKHAEKALREEKNKLKKIAATVPGVICIYRERSDGSAHMPYASPALLPIMGFKPQDVAEDMSPIVKRAHPDDAKLILESIAQSRRTLTPWHLEYRYFHPEKGIIWIEGNSVPQREADGSTIWHGIITDVTDRKRTEEALRLSEEKFSKAFMISPDSISLTRSSDGALTEVNNGSVRIFGYTREEMIGHKTLPGDLGIWVNKEDRDRMMAILKVSGEVNDFETIFRRKDGKLINGIISARIIKMKGDDYILAITRDITEQKSDEEALRLSEEKFSKAFMTSPDSVTITRLSDGKLIEINKGCMEITGYTREEMIDHTTLPGNLGIWVNKEDRDRMMAILKANGEVNGFEALLRTKDGKLINGIISAHIIKMDGDDYFLAYTRDITEQKRDEEALRLSEEKFSKAFMTSPDAMTINRLSDGIFVEINNGATKIFGYTREEIIGHSPLPGDLGIWLKKEDRDPWMASLKARGEANGFEGVFRRKDGKLFNGMLSGRVIKMHGDDYILAINRDITEQKKAEENRNRLTRELRTLSSCNEVLIRAENEQALLDDISRIICEVAGFRMTWVGFVVKGESPFINVVARAGVGILFMNGETYPLNDKEETPVDIVIRSKNSYVIQDFEKVPMGAPWRDNALKDGYRSAIVLPLLDDTGNPFGVLSIYSEGPGGFTPVEIKLLEELGSDLAFGIRNLRLRVERGLAQSALVHEKELSDALLEAAPGFFCVLDHKGGILRMNKIMEKLMGGGPLNPLKYVYRDDLEPAMQRFNSLLKAGHLEDDFRLEFKPGEITWWHISGHAVTIQRTIYIIAAAFDITQRKQIEENLKKALKEKDVLLQELYHRTRNNMQVISSFLTMQSIALDDEKLRTILNEMENRISAMALVHEKLYKSKDLTNINLREYLKDLSDLLFRSFPTASKKVTLVYEAEEVFVTIDIAIPIGLVVTELFTNSLKYAFPDVRSGKICLQMKRHDRDELELNISDNGIGAPGKFDFGQKNTIGIPMVLSIVRKQLRGSIELDSAHGFNWKISFRCDLYGKRV
jgi:PAS domain S-box-containing protein